MATKIPYHQYEIANLWYRVFGRKSPAELLSEYELLAAGIIVWCLTVSTFSGVLILRHIGFFCTKKKKANSVTSVRKMSHQAVQQNLCLAEFQTIPCHQASFHVDFSLNIVDEFSKKKPDQTALWYCCKQWAERYNGPNMLKAIIFYCLAVANISLDLADNESAERLHVILCNTKFSFKSKSGVPQKYLSYDHQCRIPFESSSYLLTVHLKLTPTCVVGNPLWVSQPKQKENSVAEISTLLMQLGTPAAGWGGDDIVLQSPH
uniref:Matrix protein n=1 Tax=Shelduck rhabdovirus TaxID=2212784 RepID=A0A3G1RPH4_9RHAB|nr:MAG: matrix protein [Shelduck rhabdovirus]